VEPSPPWKRVYRGELCSRGCGRARRAGQRYCRECNAAYQKRYRSRSRDAARILLDPDRSDADARRDALEVLTRALGS
jgi:hypothetical protein